MRSVISFENQAGFTLIELLITIAIVSILAAIAIPCYQDYIRRAAYTEVVAQADPYKIGVMNCYQLLGDLTGCNDGSNDIPAAVSAGTGMVASAVVKDGVITITPNPLKGILSTDIYVLTPIPPGEGTNAVLWKSSGEGVKKGYAK